MFSLLCCGVEDFLFFTTNGGFMHKNNKLNSHDAFFLLTDFHYTTRLIHGSEETAVKQNLDHHIERENKFTPVKCFVFSLNMHDLSINI